LFLDRPYDFLFAEHHQQFKVFPELAYGTVKSMEITIVVGKKVLVCEKTQNALCWMSFPWATR